MENQDNSTHDTFRLIPSLSKKNTPQKAEEHNPAAGHETSPIEGIDTTPPYINLKPSPVEQNETPPPPHTQPFFNTPPLPPPGQPYTPSETNQQRNPPGNTTEHTTAPGPPPPAEFGSTDQPPPPYPPEHHRAPNPQTPPPATDIDTDDTHDETPWPSNPENSTAVPLEVLAAETADEYQQDIPTLMGRYSKKTPTGEHDRTKDFSRWEKSPTLTLASVGFFLGVGVFLTLGVLLRNVTTIYGSFVIVRDKLTTAKTAFTRSQTIELAQSIDAIHLLWFAVALGVLYMHGKALIGVIFGSRGSLIWLRTTAAFWIFIFLLTLMLFPLEPWHSTIYTIIQWGSLPLGFALLSLSFAPKLRDWVKF